MNPNFAERVSFDFSLIDREQDKPTNSEKEIYLARLSDFLFEKAEQYSSKSEGNAKVLIEFITKKTASSFFSILKQDERSKGYKLFILSGDNFGIQKEKNN